MSDPAPLAVPEATSYNLLKPTTEKMPPPSAPNNAPYSSPKTLPAMIAPVIAPASVIGISISSFGIVFTRSDRANRSAASSLANRSLSPLVLAVRTLFLAASIFLLASTKRVGICLRRTLAATRLPYSVLRIPPSFNALAIGNTASSIILRVTSLISSSDAFSTDFPRLSSNSLISFLLPLEKNFTPAAVTPTNSGMARTTCSVTVASGRQYPVISSASRSLMVPT